jgi:hypothetical protein
MKTCSWYRRETFQTHDSNKQKTEQSGREQPDVVVYTVAWALGEVQYVRGKLAYTRLTRLWDRVGWPPLYFNYAYGFGWAILLGVLLTLSVSTSLTTSLALVASFRYFEIVVWYLKLLFDSMHKLILSAERNLLFLVIDGTASIAIVWLWLDAGSRHAGTEPAWSAAVTVFTLNGAPEQYDGWQSTAGTVLGTVAGLLLIVAGLAVLIELVGRRFQYGPAEDYTGPQRLPPPWRR